MRIANAEHDGQAKVVFAADEEWLDFTAALAAFDSSLTPVTSIQQLLDAGRFDLDLFRRVYNRKFRAAGALRFRAPFSRPGQIIALARNYTAHARESTLPIPHEPIFFSKSNTSVIGPDDAVILPPNLGRVEPEIELAIVIGRQASHVPAARAQ